MTPHVLRHTLAMELLQAGVDRSVIALWLGHESVETTQIYLDANLALKEQILAKLGTRVAVLHSMYDVVMNRSGELPPDVARGMKLRHDCGSQYRSGHFQGSLAWVGIEDRQNFVGAPQGNAVACRASGPPDDT